MRLPCRRWKCPAEGHPTRERGGELFSDDDFSAEREKVKKRLAGIVLHANAAVGVWGAQDIADMETDAVISEAHEEGHGRSGRGWSDGSDPFD